MYGYFNGGRGQTAEEEARACFEPSGSHLSSEESRTGNFANAGTTSWRKLVGRGRLGPDAVDVDDRPRRKSGFLAHFHRHGDVDPQEITTLLDEVGLRSVRSGPVGFGNLHFVLAVPAG